MSENTRIRLSTKALVEDKDVEEIEISVVLKEGKTSKGLSPFAMERALLSYIAGHFVTWSEYWMKPGSALG